MIELTSSVIEAVNIITLGSLQESSILISICIMPPPLCDFIIRKKEITFNKLEIVGLFGNIDGYFSRLFLYGEAGGFFWAQG